MFLPTLVAALLGTAAAGPASPAGTPNFALVVIDDLGTDLVGAYGDSPHAPATPNIDKMAEEGTLFRNFWTSPICSPSRARMLTGRYGQRTGLGMVIKQGHVQAGLDPAEVIIPEVLPGYVSAAVGKWHLGNVEQGLQHPLDVGFQRFAGHQWGVHFGAIGAPGCGDQFDYFHWILNLDGVEMCSDVYATTYTGATARAAVRRMPEPWFLQVAFQSPHTPLHQAPYSHGATGDSELSMGQSMVESVDIQLGHLLDTIQELRPNTYVFVVGDNGTTAKLAQGGANGCFEPHKSKNTLYEGGVRVPMLVRGPGVAAGVEIHSIAESTDFFATMCELAGVESSAEDSVSMVPYLQGDDTPLKSAVYAEMFSPNGDPHAAYFWNRAIRGERYKLVRQDFIESFYDLQEDPCEIDDLCDGTPSCISQLSGPELAAYLSLSAQLDALGEGEALAAAGAPAAHEVETNAAIATRRRR